MYDTIKFILFFLHSLICVISIILHLIGIHLLHKTKSLSTNQTIHLMNISIVEIILSAIQGLFIFFRGQMKSQIIFNIMALAVAPGWIISLMALTVDRFLEVKLNILYPVYVTQGVSKIPVFIEVLVGISVVLAIIFAKEHVKVELVHTLHKGLFPTMAGTMMTIFLFVYVYIYVKLRNSNRIGPNHKSEVSQCNLEQTFDHQTPSTTNTPVCQKSTETTKPPSKMHFFIPFWIVVTYVLFFIFPECSVLIMLYGYHFDLMKSSWFIIPYLFFGIGWITDALIYILLKSTIRKHFLRLFAWKEKRVESIKWSHHTAVEHSNNRTVQGSINR